MTRHPWSYLFAEKWQGVLLLSVCPKKKVPQEDDKKKFGLTGMAF